MAAQIGTWMTGTEVLRARPSKTKTLISRDAVLSAAPFEVCSNVQVRRAASYCAIVAVPLSTTTALAVTSELLEMLPVVGEHTSLSPSCGLSSLIVARCRWV